MVKPGEVWTSQRKDGLDSEVLVVAFNDNVATILHLMDECKDGCIEVVGSDVKWANPRMMNWSWGGYLGKRVRKLSVQEFDQVCEEIGRIMKIHIVKEVECVENAVPDPAAFLEIESMKAELEALHCRRAEAEAAADKYRIQLDLMKTMYADLMEKFLQR